MSGSVLTTGPAAQSRARFPGKAPPFPAVPAKPSAGQGSESLTRRFVFYYVAFALIPFILLFYIFSQYGVGTYRISISQINLGVMIMLVGLASLIGFLAMRSMLNKVARLTEHLRQSLEGGVDRAFIQRMMNEEGEVAELAKSFNIIINDLETNISELERTRSTLYQVLSKVGHALASMDDFDSLIGLTLETSVNAIGVRDGAVFAAQPDGTFRLVTFLSDKTGDPDRIRASAQRYIDWISHSPNLLVMPSMPGAAASEEIFAPPVVCAPLLCRGQNRGLLCLSGKRNQGHFTEDEINLITNLATQIAVSFENLRLNEDRERTYFETIAALALAVEARDPYSRGHSDRVCQWAVRIGRSMNLPEKDVLTIRDAARMHDVGKIGISDLILQKQDGPLSGEEYEIMKQHPVIGEKIVAPMKSFDHLRDPVRHHHEKLDGSGYPDGLRGDQISLLTRIITVADIFDALNEARPYRAAMPPEKVKAEFESMVQRGLVDGLVVKHLFKVVADAKALGPGPDASPALINQISRV